MYPQIQLYPSYMDHSSNSSDIIGHSDVDPLNNLYPALVQCFTVIIMGYLAGRFSLLTSAQAKGIGIYVSTFALPALLFKSMCELQFSMVNWLFLAGITIAKTAVFIVVFLLTLVVIRPRHFGKVGMYAIFATQSNDLALGYPIIKALYSATHPEFVNYLYLVTPISVIILNPIGFVFLEVNKWQHTHPSQRSSKYRAIIQIVKGVVLNPIVFMSAFGIAGNFAFGMRVPDIINGILTVLGNSFSASALFYLGHNMVGKLGSLNNRAVLTPILLILAKMLLMPLVSREATYMLLRQSNISSNETSDLASYAFLYGTIPTAPSVFLFASYYSVAKTVVAIGLVLGTILSAPYMFISAKMVTLQLTSATEYAELIIDTAFDFSILTMILSFWVICLLVLTRRWRSIPHQLTLSLAVSQILAGLGTVLWSKVDTRVEWQHYLQYTLYYIGVMSARCWAAMLALGLCLLKVKGICFVLRYKALFYIYSYGIPIIMTTILYTTSHQHKYSNMPPDFLYGLEQQIISTTVLSLTIVIIIASLVIQHRYDRSYMGPRSRYNSLNEDGANDYGPERQSTPGQNKDSEPGPSDTQSTSQSADDITAKQNGDIRQNGSTNGGFIGDAEAGNSHDSTSSAKDGRKGKVFGRKEKVLQTKDCADCTDCSAKSGVTAIEDIVAFPSNDATRTCDKQPALTTDEAQAESGSSDTSTINTTPSEIQSLHSTEYRCANPQTCNRAGGCQSLLQHYEMVQFGQLTEEEQEILLRRDEYQIVRHIILVICLLVSAFIGVFLCLWSMFKEDKVSGIYLELQFLDTFFNYGQGIFTFVIFGLDIERFVSPIIRRIKKYIYGRELSLPPLEDLDSETKHTCEQFCAHHIANCRKELLGCKWVGLRRYKCVFLGTELTDWLIEYGLAHDEAEAVIYGNQLLNGRIIQHIHREHHFSNTPYIYKFCDVRQF